LTESEYRKLQVTGGSTMIVSLPREWVKANQMKKGDVVFIEEMSSGGLHISAMQSESSKSSVTIDCCKLSDGLVDLLIGAYLSGADVIKVVCSSNIPRKVRKDIRNFLRDTRGMEIGLDEDKEIRILSILDPSELSFQVSINRMYILISSLVNDAYDVLVGEDLELLSDIEDRERQIDARRLLVERQVAAAVKKPVVERNLGTDRFSALEHANIARILERMGDHAARLAFLVRDNSTTIKSKTTEMPLRAIPEWAEQLKILVHNMYTKDVSLIHGAKLSLGRLMKEIEGNESDLWTGRKSSERLFSEFQISESIRRICAYGVNFAESLLNMLMHERMESIE
jgi:phosphate uptake regulator